MNRYLYIVGPPKGLVEVMLMPRGRPPICPFCNSHNSQKKGFRITKTMGVRQIRLCKNCKRKFTPKNQKLKQPEAASP